MDSGYRLPAGVRDRLGAAVGGFRNRDAAFALGVYLARYWSAPRRLAMSFPVDRRAMAISHSLGLTEAKVRGALRVLVASGFLERVVMPGSAYKRTVDGPHRKP